MPDMLYASPIFGQPGDAWTTLNAPHNLHMGKHNVGKHTRRETGPRQVVEFVVISGLQFMADARFPILD
jgi:hypothetical protein